MAPLFSITKEALESGGQVAEVTFNRPKTMNAMTVEDLPTVVKAFDELATDGDVKVIILTGAGKAFSAGADLSVAMKIFQGEASPTSPELNVVAAMERLPQPLIGAINGPAITGGFEVALGCDILLAGRSASFADTHAKFGIHPCWGLSQKLQRLVGASRAMHISLSADAFSGEQAAQWGLVSQVLPDEELLPAARALARTIGNNHPKLVQRYKQLINDGGMMTLADARQMERDKADSYYKGMGKDDFAAMQKFLTGRGGPKKAKL